MTDGHQPPARRLIVARHAKSDWPVGVPDKDRPLARRGRRDAPEAGCWLAEHVGHLDLVVHSDARRTRETWAALEPALRAAGGSVDEVRSSARVYEAEVDDLLAVLRAVPDDVASVLLIGHNPGVQDLVLALAGKGSESAAALAAAKFPTSALAVLTVKKSWSGLGPKDATLDDVVVPRG